MKLMSAAFWLDLKQNLKGLDDMGIIRKVTIILEPQQPAMLYLKVLADRKPEGRLLTKTYQLVEVETDETEKFLPVEDGELETTNLSSIAVEHMKADSFRTGGYR